MNSLELQMKKIVDEKVQHYKSDFEHDLEFMWKNKPECFIWIVRVCGTNYINFWKTEDLPEAGKTVPFLFGTADREKIIQREYQVFSECFNETEHSFFFVEPSKGILRKITKSEGSALLSNHIQKLHERWNSERNNYVCISK